MFLLGESPHPVLPPLSIVLVSLRLLDFYELFASCLDGADKCCWPGGVLVSVCACVLFIASQLLPSPADADGY